LYNDLLRWNDLSNGWRLERPELVGGFLKAGVLPIARDGQSALAAAPDPDAEGAEIISRATDRGIPVIKSSRKEMASFVHEKAQAFLGNDAGRGLYERDRINSALMGILPVQYAISGIIAATLVISTILAPVATLNVVTSIFIIILVLLVIFRFACMAAGGARDKLGIDASALAALRDEELPSYSVMVPMLRERESTLRGLVGALSGLDYPTDRLQIQLVLEETDLETRAIVEGIPLPDWFDIVLIPDMEPHTKGKACNYALYFASGEFFTIYDAEDHPDPMQLKKAVIAFRLSGPEVVCAQSHLNFYNVRENWLTRMFTLDYTVWYDFMLPGLEKLDVPICLGGTSNHFKTSVVRELDGWDAFNVTEDADLGLRFAKKGYRTIMLDSTTLEEANMRVGSWIRQRSRWMKGYMLTYLVHMRQPLAFLRTIGLWRFLGVQLFVGGNFMGNLINPPLWGVTLLWGSNEIWPWTESPLFPDSFWHPAMFAFVVGNSAAIGFTMLAAWRRGLYDLIPLALTLPIYWVMAAIASYKALVELFTRPFYWEKTEHGMTQVVTPHHPEAIPAVAVE